MNFIRALISGLAALLVFGTSTLASPTISVQLPVCQTFTRWASLQPVQLHGLKPWHPIFPDGQLKYKIDTAGLTKAKTNFKGLFVFEFFRGGKTLTRVAVGPNSVCEVNFTEDFNSVSVSHT